MEYIETAIGNYQVLAWAVLIVAFVILAKCADLFVESAVGLADKFKIPRLVIGIVMVSLATTAPVSRCGHERAFDVPGEKMSTGHRSSPLLSYV